MTLRGYLECNWANSKPFFDPDLNGQLAGISSCESNYRRSLIKVGYMNSMSTKSITSVTQSVKRGVKSDYLGIASG